MIVTVEALLHCVRRRVVHFRDGTRGSAGERLVTLLSDELPLRSTDSIPTDLRAGGVPDHPCDYNIIHTLHNIRT